MQTNDASNMTISPPASGSEERKETTEYAKPLVQAQRRAKQCNWTKGK